MAQRLLNGIVWVADRGFQGGDLFAVGKGARGVCHGPSSFGYNQRMLRQPSRLSHRLCWLMLVAGTVFLDPRGLSAQSVPGSIPAPQMAGSADAARAQARELVQGASEWGFWGGGSIHSATLVGVMQNSKVGLLALSYGRVLRAWDSVAFTWTVDALPVVVLSYPQSPPISAGSGGPAYQKTRQDVYGAGLSPIGLRFDFRPRRRLQPFVDNTYGFVYFGQPVPDSRGAQFNFRIDFGGGLRVRVGSNQVMTFGYKFNHISNGYRGQINPGFDAHVLYFGFSFRRAKPR